MGLSHCVCIRTYVHIIHKHTYTHDKCTCTYVHRDVHTIASIYVLRVNLDRERFVVRLCQQEEVVGGGISLWELRSVWGSL